MEKAIHRTHGLTASLDEAPRGSGGSRPNPEPKTLQLEYLLSQAHGRCKIFSLTPDAMNANGLLQIDDRYVFGLTVTPIPMPQA